MAQSKRRAVQEALSQGQRQEEAKAKLMAPNRTMNMIINRGQWWEKYSHSVIKEKYGRLCKKLLRQVLLYYNRFGYSVATP